MKRTLTLAIILLVLFPLLTFANNESVVKAGFIRDGNLWTLINNHEKQITSTGKVISKPKWSHDGKWLLYQKESTSGKTEPEQQVEIWVYNVETMERKKVFYNGSSPTWAPHKNIVAFNMSGILNISDLNQFYNVAPGVSSYTWKPDGNGFLLATAAILRPDSWTNIELFKKEINGNYNDIPFYDDVKHFFTIPKRIGINGKKIIAVDASHFEFSPSSKWISFIVSPTASLSMDSNMLCVISRDGEDFEVLDEVIFGVGEPKWAPSSDTIAFIAGGGRLVSGFKNKDLKIQEMPVTGSYTPPNFIDLDFDWVTNKSIVTSRMEEKEWSNHVGKQPLPSLYFINLDSNKQTEITNPPKGYGDYSPQYIKSIEKLVWLRGTSIIDRDKTIWKANPDGSAAKKWLKNVDAIEFY